MLFIMALLCAIFLLIMYLFVAIARPRITVMIMLGNGDCEIYTGICFVSVSQH